MALSSGGKGFKPHITDLRGRRETVRLVLGCRTLQSKMKACFYSYANIVFIGSSFHLFDLFGFSGIPILNVFFLSRFVLLFFKPFSPAEKKKATKEAL